MHRLFGAIRPPEAVRDLLIDAMGVSPELRWVQDENDQLVPHPDVPATVSHP